MGSVLLVEDDRSLRESLRECLTREGYRLDLASNAVEAERSLRGSEYDLVVVDVGLPDASGFTVGRLVKEISRAGLIFLTAMNSAESRLEGFEIGADDYIPKPFHLKELLLRIQRVLDAKHIAPRIQSGPVTLNVEAKSIVFCDGREATPQVRDFELLSLLVRSSPRIVSRREIIEALWPPSRALVTERTVDNAIVRLRDVLGPEGAPHLQSVRGLGYRWEPTRSKCGA